MSGVRHAWYNVEPATYRVCEVLLAESHHRGLQSELIDVNMINLELEVWFGPSGFSLLVHRMLHCIPGSTGQLASSPSECKHLP